MTDFLDALPPNLRINAKAGKPFELFASKAGIHHGMDNGSMRPFMGDEAREKCWQALDQERQGSAAVYVHMPYCQAKCTYCGFFGGLYNEELGNAYTEALIQEMRAEAQTRAVLSSAPVNAVYFGGGTPTALSAVHLKRLIGAVKEIFPLANDCEITIEGRNYQFDAQKIEACLQAGANRFSIGVQTFDTALRRGLGRFSDQEAVISSLQMLQSYNQAAVIIDLIYGLPGQTLESWVNGIKQVYDLQLDGCDLYQLNILPDTTLAQQSASGKLSLPGVEERYAMFEAGLRLTEELGFRRLSVSHWGLGSRERNIYNLLTKSRADAFIYGAGAGGSMNGWFGANTRDPKQYLDNIKAGKKPLAMLLPPKSRRQRALTAALSLQAERLRVDIAQIEKTAGADGAAQALQSALTYLTENGLLARQAGSSFVFTEAGQFWQVNVAQILHQALAQAA